MACTKAVMHARRAELQQHFIGCTPGAVGVLFAIREGNRTEGRRMKVSEISKLMHVTSPTVTQFIKDLEARDLVERHIDQADRRAVWLALTEKGEHLLSQMEELFAATFRDLTDYLGEDDSNQLASLLTKAYRYLREREGNVHQSQWNGDDEA
jgi:DNA-binding MarR family transcriptional regulator